VIERVIADEATERLTAKLSVLGFVHLVEDRALVPVRSLVPLERAAELALGDIHEADLQHLVGLGVSDEVLQSTPRALEPLEIGVVDDLVHLGRELLVDRRDDRLDRLDDIRTDKRRLCKRLLRKRLNGLLDGGLRLFGPRTEFLAEERGDVAAFDLDAGERTGLALGICHSGSLEVSGSP